MTTDVNAGCVSCVMEGSDESINLTADVLHKALGLHYPIGTRWMLITLVKFGVASVVGAEPRNGQRGTRKKIWRIPKRITIDLHLC